jgi:hypothetical protein
MKLMPLDWTGIRRKLSCYILIPARLINASTHAGRRLRVVDAFANP